MAGKPNRRGFGYLRRLPSKRYQASYVGPDLGRHTAPATFQTRSDAEAWLSAEQGLIASGKWSSPKVRKLKHALTFGDYADTWLADRKLKPRTREHYRSLLDHQLANWEDIPLKAITPASVRSWYAGLPQTRPTLRAHAYGLLRAILATAVTDDEIQTNPCHIRGAGNAKRVTKTEPATLEQLEVIVTEMPERLRPMVLLAAWCALRFGELVELRRRDVDLKNGVIKVRRGAVRVDGKVIVGAPKTDAGIRDVAVPPHLLPLLKEHLNKGIIGGRDGLLFPAADGVSTLAPSSLYGPFYKAREAAGRPDLRFHDLRHSGATMAAQTGATLAELMGRLGHSTPQAALRYQHAAKGRDAEIARALSRLADGAVK